MSVKKNGRRRVLVVTITLILLMFVLSFFLLLFFQQEEVFYPDISFNDFAKALKSGKIEQVEAFPQGSLKIRMITGELFSLQTASLSFDFLKSISENTTLFFKKYPHGSGMTLVKLLSSWLFQALQVTTVLILAANLLRNVFKGAKSIFDRENKSFDPEDVNKIGFKQVAANKGPKEQVLEIVEFLKDPKKFIKMGAKIPKGILFYGPPGTGKTLLARAMAGEAGVPFFFASSGEFEEAFVGVGASRIRSLFNKAKESAPCIIFLDEVDTIASARSKEKTSTSDQTLNELLHNLDGFETNTGIVVVASTNRLDILDPAFIRSGRFDRIVNFQNPNFLERQELFSLYTKHKPVDSTVSAEELSMLTYGMNGADIANIANEAAIMAAKKGDSLISQHHVIEAFEKIVFGPKTMAQIENLYLTAIHECGHTIMAYLNEERSKKRIYKVTVEPRSDVLGMLMQVSTTDVPLSTPETLDADICISLGGRIAEIIIFGQEHATTGAYSDLQSVRYTMKKFVETHLLTESVSSMAVQSNEIGVQYSPSHLENSEQIIKKRLQALEEQTKKSLLKYKDVLIALAKELEVKGSMLRAEIIAFIKNSEKIYKIYSKEEKSEQDLINIAQIPSQKPVLIKNSFDDRI